MARQIFCHRAILTISNIFMKDWTVSFLRATIQQLFQLLLQGLHFKQKQQG